MNEENEAEGGGFQPRPQRKRESVIAEHPPRDGREWDCQCARCGGSMDWRECEACTDGYSHHDCGEDSCCCLYPEDNVPCDLCEGYSGWNVCGNPKEWCKSHPRPGREQMEGGVPEWFTSDPPRAAAGGTRR